MRSVATRWLARAAFVTLPCCASTVRVEPPEGQILLFVDTDAPVVSAGGARARIDEPAPLFDRLRIEVFPPDATTPCEGCVNEFALDSDRLRALGVSVGVVPTPGVSGFRARVRMFLAAHMKATEPHPDGTIDVVLALPPIEANGRSVVSVTLHTDDVGKPVGSLDGPIDPDSGAPAESLVGTWPKAARTPCASPPRDGEVCIPGGAYWMGGRRGPWSFLPAHDTLPPRLVVVSPFYLGAHEVTVRDFRGTTVGPNDVTPWSGDGAGQHLEDFCTYTETPGIHEDYPLSCINWATAQRYCVARGGDLPSEAQWEYVASGLVGSTYVWGEDPPSCPDAVYSRLGWGMFTTSVAECKPPSPPGGSTSIGSGARDRLVLPTGTVVDLMGNVAEWLSDRWNRSSERCWSKPGVHVDPRCEGGPNADGTFRSARGGDWLVSGAQLAHTVRLGAPEVVNFYSPELGLRCMRRE